MSDLRCICGRVDGGPPHSCAHELKAEVERLRERVTAADDNAMFLSERVAQETTRTHGLQAVLNRWLEVGAAMGLGPIAQLTQDTLDILGGALVNVAERAGQRDSITDDEAAS